MSPNPSLHNKYKSISKLYICPEVMEKVSLTHLCSYLLGLGLDKMSNVLIAALNLKKIYFNDFGYVQGFFCLGDSHCSVWFYSTLTDGLNVWNVSLAFTVLLKFDSWLKGRTSSGCTFAIPSPCLHLSCGLAKGCILASFYFPYSCPLMVHSARMQQLGC